MSNPSTIKTFGIIDRCKKYLPQPGFARSVLVLAGGTAFAQGLYLLFSPILTRLYTPADFGAIAAYISVLSILSVVVSWRYELAVPIPEDEKVARNLLLISLVILSGMTISVAIAVLVFGGPLVRLLNTPELQHYIWLLPISLFGVGLYQVLNYWAIRHKAFHHISKTKINQSVGQVVTQLVLGVLNFGQLGLLLGDVIGRVGGSGTLATLAWKDNKGFFKEVSLSEMQNVARRYYKFPVLSTTSSLLNSASFQLPIILLSHLFGNAVVGWFALSLRVLQTPMTFIGQAVSQVYFPHASEAKRNGTLSNITLDIYKQLVKIGLAPALLLGLAGVELFTLFFGDKWSMAGVYTQWLAPWLLLVFITSPLSSLVFILEKQQGEMFFQAGLLVGRLVALVYGAHLNSATTAIILYSVVSAILWFVYMFWLLNITGNSILNSLKILFQELIVSFTIISPLLLTKLLIANNNQVLTLSSCLIVVLLVIGRTLNKLRNSTRNSQNM